jgi:hypothetical protein
VYVAELTGPSGVGKSAIYEEMLKLGGFIPNPQIGVYDAVEVINKFPPSERLSNFLSFIRFVQRNSDGPKKDVRIGAIVRALAKMLQAHSAIKKQIRPWMIIDGGIIHRGQSIDRLAPHIPIRRYFEIAPMPGTAVMVTADKEVAKQRNRDREEDRSEDTERSFEVHRIAREVLEQRGVRIIDIDTTHTPPAENAYKIMVELGIKRDFGGANAAGYNQRRECDPKWLVEQRMVEKLLQEEAPGTTVLDIPCGTGRFFGCYKTLGLNVLGVDKSPDMLKEAAKNGGAGIELREGDILDLDLEDKSFDVAVMVRMTRWLSPEQNKQAIAALKRIVKRRIIFTARIADHPHARPLDLFVGDGWEIARNLEGHEPNYQIVELKPT